MMGNCPVCGETVFPDLRHVVHRCPPKWWASQEQSAHAYDEDCQPIFALRPDRAAEKYLAWLQETSSEYEEGVFTVWVRIADQPDAQPEAFKVRMELAPSYLAMPVVFADQD